MAQIFALTRSVMIQLPISGLTGHVNPSTHMYGNRVNQELWLKPSPILREAIKALPAATLAAVDISLAWGLGRDRKMPLVNREVLDGNGTYTPKGSGGCLDILLLIGAALLVCAIVTGSFLLAIIFHVNSAWVFVAWNSIVLVPIFIRDFRTHLRRPSFLAFLFAWALIHGLLVVALMRWMSIFAMLPILAVELTVGFVLADYLFGVRPEEKDGQ